MISSSSFPLSLNPNLCHSHLFSSQFPISNASSFSPPLSPPKFLVCFASLPPNQSNFDREEIRWLREEQRWLREEQRWLREEQRWIAERNSLLQQISELKLTIQTLKLQNQGGSVFDAVSKIGSLLQKLKDSEFVVEKETSVSPMVLGSAETEEVVVEEIGVLEKEEVGDEKMVSEKRKRNALRKGAEGEEVRAMQDALQSLGFYSGEEDIEYSSFSGGTERAVKTWQSTVGALEDGIMTLELLERLYMEQRFKSDGLNLNSNRKKEDVIGAAVASVTEVSEVKQKVVKQGVSEVEVSQHRVFLLGENRWEEPSRLVGNSKQVVRGMTKNESTKCLACRGEGRLMCTECDGTGEPNVEPQFLEWVDEGAKCPYCEGLGYTVCDICNGKTTQD